MTTLQFQTTLGSQLDIYEATHTKQGYNTTPVWEYQAMAPAPSQTFFHIGIYKQENKDPALPQTVLILRDWPRKRYSQHWTRNSDMNPGEKVIPVQELLQGDWQRELVQIFGEEVYDKIVAAASTQ